MNRINHLSLADLVAESSLIPDGFSRVGALWWRYSTGVPGTFLALSRKSKSWDVMKYLVTFIRDKAKDTCAPNFSTKLRVKMWGKIHIMIV